jgi:hypothetical protein
MSDKRFMTYSIALERRRPCSDCPIKHKPRPMPLKEEAAGLQPAQGNEKKEQFPSTLSPLIRSALFHRSIASPDELKKYTIDNPDWRELFLEVPGIGPRTIAKIEALLIRWGVNISDRRIPTDHKPTLEVLSSMGINSMHELRHYLTHREHELRSGIYDCRLSDKLEDEIFTQIRVLGRKAGVKPYDLMTW